MACDPRVVVLRPAPQVVVTHTSTGSVATTTRGQTIVQPVPGTAVEAPTTVSDVVVQQPLARVIGIVERGRQGPKGEPGADGAGGTLLLPVGETIHGRRAVRVADGELFRPDTSNASHAAQVVGISMQAGSVPSELSVRTRGPITESTWNWLPGAVWCDNEGILTQSVPATGWLLQIGRAIDVTTIDIDIDTPFFRS